MKKGNIVDIYIEPITKVHFEGKAKLIKKISKTDIFEVWEVEFIDEQEKTCCRTIYIGET